MAAGSSPPTGNVTLAAGLHQFAAINLASGLRLTAAGGRVLDLRSLGADGSQVIDVSGADGAAGIDRARHQQRHAGEQTAAGADQQSRLLGSPGSGAGLSSHGGRRLRFGGSQPASVRAPADWGGRQGNRRPAIPKWVWQGRRGLTAAGASGSRQLESKSIKSGSKGSGASGSDPVVTAEKARPRHKGPLGTSRSTRPRSTAGKTWPTICTVAHQRQWRHDRRAAAINL